MVGATLGWIWLTTVGDALRLDRPLNLVALGWLALGVLWGASARSRTSRVALAITAALALAFWIGAPAGWWALPPSNQAHGSSISVQGALVQVATCDSSMKIACCD